ncbi:MAG: hypothetical protein E4G91_07005, partial [Candidatus Zixiibacteriota bacterium]
MRRSAETALDDQAAHALKLRAVTVATQVSQLLRSAVADLKTLALLPPTEQRYLEFFRLHRSPIWYRSGTNEHPAEVRVNLPLYEEIAFIAADGYERLRIVQGQISDDLRHVAVPAKTTYLN